jgi:2-methylisocitrate lyase-like PEP mutase family enzyme
VNVLVSSDLGLSVADLADIGVRRISVGSALARAAWTGFMRAAQLISKEGSFKGLDGLVPFSEINNFFREAH